MNAQTPQPAQPKKDSNMYSSSYGSIFVKNYLAGMARAFGAVTIYIVFLVFIGYLANLYFFPHFEPLFTSIERLSQITDPSTQIQHQIDPNQINNLLNQFNELVPPSPQPGNFR